MAPKAFETLLAPPDRVQLALYHCIKRSRYRKMVDGYPAGAVVRFANGRFRMVRVVVAVLLVTMLAGCAQQQTPDIAQMAAATAQMDRSRMISIDFDKRREAMAAQFPPSAPGTQKQREEFARRQVDLHIAYVVSIGAPAARAAADSWVEFLAQDPVNRAAAAATGASSTAKAEAESLVDAMAARRGASLAVIRERARENLGPGATASAIRNEEARLTRIATTELDRREAHRRLETRRQADADRLARQEDYCRDLAHNIWVRTARSDEFYAGLILGRSSQMENHYQDCMASFRRVDRFLGN